MRRFSIRTRITVGSLVVAAVLLVLALLIVRGQVAMVLSNADTSLATSDLLSFQQDLAANPDESIDDPGSGVLVYIRAPDGTVDVNTLPDDIADLVRNQPAAIEQFTTTDDDGRAFVVVARTVATNDGTWALWSARSAASSELALEGLDRVLVVAGLILLAGFGIASWVLASAALRPVTGMRLDAQKLGEAETTGRLPVGRADDELAALATTLNAFLDRVHSTALREKQMVSDASHELRTPLAVLKTQLEIAHADDGDAPALEQHLRAAEASVDRLTSLASNLLELSRIESGGSSGLPSDARELVDEFMDCVDRARLLAVAKNASVMIDLVTIDESARCSIDRYSFARLVDNLLSNAVHAIAVGGTITAVLRDIDGSISVEVGDNGPGMPEEFLPIAFERFSRPDASRAAATGGSGLGLALVLAVAQAAGGTAGATNTSPGLRVTVVLPKM